MKLRYAGACVDCGTEIDAGVVALWYREAKEVRCLPCGETTAVGPDASVARTDDATASTEVNSASAMTEAATEAPAAPDEAEATEEAEQTVESVEAEQTEDPVVDEVQRAGASARREHERRSERERKKKEKIVADDAEWRRRAVEKRPVVGRVVTAFTAKPTIGPESQPTAAWKVGAEGEERVAEVLAPVEGIEVLHDRAVPGTRANIDHIVVGPAGIYVVDAKKYKHGAPIEARDVGSWFKPDVRLYVDGRNRTNLVDAVLGQIEVVRTALGDDLQDVPIRGVLCFIGPNWGWRPKTKTVKGVTSVWPLGLPTLVSRDGPHRLDIAQITAHLRTALPPAT